MNKIKLWNEDGFVYELLNGVAYLDEARSQVYIVRLPTDNELDGFYEYSEPDFLELEISKDESELYVINHTFTKSEFVKLCEELTK